MVRLLFCGALAALLALSACDSGSPERLFNDAAQPPEPVPFSALDTTRAYAGDFPLAVTPDLAPFPILRAYAIVDGLFEAGCEDVPCTIMLRTGGMADGPHTLHLVLSRTEVPDPRDGLLNLVAAGAVVSSATFITDQRPPTPVAIDSVRTTTEGIEVYWTSPAGTNRNARSFYIVRSAGATPVGAPIVGQVDPGAPHVFVDRTVPDVEGLPLRYYVGTWNGRGEHPGGEADGSALSEGVVGNTRPRYGGAACTSIAQPFAAGSFLCLQGDVIRRGVIADGRFVASGPAPRLLAGATTRELVAAPDGSAYYLVESTWPDRFAFAAVDPLTLALGPVRTPTLPSGARVGHTVAAGGRLFSLGFEGGVAAVIDGTQGAVVGSIPFVGSSDGTGLGASLVVTPDARYLLHATPAGIRRVDLTTMAALDLNTDLARRVAVDADGRLYVGSSVFGDHLRVYDVATLALLEVWANEGPVDAIWVSRDHVFTATYAGSSETLHHALVSRYRSHNGTPAGTRPFAQFPAHFAPSADGAMAAATAGGVTFSARFD